MKSRKNQNASSQFNTGEGHCELSIKELGKSTVSFIRRKITYLTW